MSPKVTGTAGTSATMATASAEYQCGKDRVLTTFLELKVIRLIGVFDVRVFVKGIMFLQVKGMFVNNDVFVHKNSRAWA